VDACWQELAAAGLSDTIPVAYINSAASIKAFCGARGGLVCTSSNAAAALEWAWGRATRVLFLPDEHLGRNTAWTLGVPLDEMVVWDPDRPNGGLPPGATAAARLVLWAGNCSVHTRFTVEQVDRLRTRHPGIRVIVHPECTWEVVQAADDSGSTEAIVTKVTASPRGSVWGVGTESRLVQRLARALHPDRTVLSLDPFGCLCPTMSRVSPNHLLWILEELAAGRVHNRITVRPEDKPLALAALHRMLALA
jgi:quinolinate synthase